MFHMLRVLALGVLMATSLSGVAAVPAFATRDGMPSLAPLLAPVTPAVVNIAVVSRSPEENNPLARDPFFRQFFGLRSVSDNADHMAPRSWPEQVKLASLDLDSFLRALAARL